VARPSDDSFAKLPARRRPSHTPPDGANKEATILRAPIFQSPELTYIVMQCIVSACLRKNWSPLRLNL
jgi:hypothetical protein